MRSYQTRNLNLYVCCYVSLSNESDGRATMKLCLAQFTDEATLNEMSGHTWLRFYVISLLLKKCIVTEHYMNT